MTKLLKALALCLLCATIRSQTLPNAVPTPMPELQFVDKAGKPIAGGKLCTYAANSNTPQATYTDSTAGTPNTNPVILDTAGKAQVWVGPLSYKYVLRQGGGATDCTTGTVVFSADHVQDTTLYFVNYVKTAGTATLITYTPPGTGAVATTVAAKLAESWSVMDFGAVGDNTTDDTAAFNLAFTAAAAATYGANLLCPAEHKFLITGQITLSSTNGPVRITGGCEIRVYNAVPFAKAFSIESSHFEMDNITIISPVASVQRLVVVTSTATSDVQFHQMNVTATLTYLSADAGAVAGFQYFGTADFYISDSYLALTGPGDPAGSRGTYGIVQSAASATRSHIERNTVLTTLLRNSVSLFDCFDCFADDNYVDQGNYTKAVNSDGYGILIYAASTNPNLRDHVNRNTIHNCSNSCIYFASVDDSEISNNIVKDCALQNPDGSLSTAGISVGGGRKTVISGNVVIASTKAGIDVSQHDDSPTGADGAAITGNTIQASGTFGIWMRGGAKNWTVTGNTIDGRAQGSGSILTTQGIHTDNTASIDRSVISGNTIEHVSAVGIAFLAGQNHTVIANNSIYDVTSGQGILITGGGAGGKIIGNDLGNMTVDSAIKVDTDGIAINSNSLHNITGKGITASGVRAHVEGNTVTGSTTALTFEGNNGLAIGNDLRGNSNVGIGYGATTGGFGFNNRFSDNPMTGVLTMPGGSPNDLVVTADGGGAGGITGVQVTRTGTSGAVATCFVKTLATSSFTFECDNATDLGTFFWSVVH